MKKVISLLLSLMLMVGVTCGLSTVAFADGWLSETPQALEPDVMTTTTFYGEDNQALYAVYTFNVPADNTKVTLYAESADKKLLRLDGMNTYSVYSFDDVNNSIFDFTDVDGEDGYNDAYGVYTFTHQFTLPAGSYYLVYLWGYGYWDDDHNGQTISVKITYDTPVVSDTAGSSGYADSADDRSGTYDAGDYGSTSGGYGAPGGISLFGRWFPLWLPILIGAVLLALLALLIVWLVRRSKVSSNQTANTIPPLPYQQNTPYQTPNDSVDQFGNQTPWQP